MKLLSFIFSIFLIFFGIQTTILILLTAHEVDVSFLILNGCSIIVFCFSVYTLYQFYYKKNKRGLLLFLLILVSLIFGYYTYDIFSKGDNKGIITYQPLFGVVGSLMLFLDVLVRKNA